VLSPPAAPAQLANGSLHAYLGADPFAGGAVPPAVARVESLAAYVVVTLNPGARFPGDAGRRCVAARAVAEALAAIPGYEPLPYPVTPYHPDYLQHADLATGASTATRVAWDGPPLRVRAGDPGAATLISPTQRAAGPDWDATVETVEIAPLWAEAAVGPNGGGGAPWLKMGWHHAYRVLRDAVPDTGARQRVDALHEQLAAGEVAPETRRLTLERELVSTLRVACERTIAGYTRRSEILNADYSGGVENAAYDAQAGLGSAIFPRTVKLKDFPWNGWLALGIDAAPTAAWNPIAGFTDNFGRLMWSAVGDPALIPSPNEPAWMFNRISDVQSSRAK
jgi:hypothetical protein